MASAAPPKAAETSKKPNKEPALSPPRSRKEYHEIDESLDNPNILPGAPWGFVVVRTVYGPASDAPWARMLEYLRSKVANSLLLADRTDLLRRHELTVIEDEAALSGADSHTVRRVFGTWVAEDLTPRLSEIEKLGGTAQIRAKLISNTLDVPACYLPPRWDLCIFMDEECLKSLDTRDTAVKILIRHWEEDSADSDEDDDYKDVGWMYMGGRSILPGYVGMYELMTDLFAWEEFYQPPYEGYLDK
jgi:hypothetical protein